MRLSKILTISLFVASSAFAGEILFLDMNQSVNEINAAKKAATDRGDTLIIYPPAGQRFEQERFVEVIKDKKFNSLIISGHSGGSGFYGTNGNVEIDEILSALENSSSKDEVKSLYLMGCYTGNKSKTGLWISSLPNVKFVAGFDAQAPLDTQPAAAQYLHNLMLKENSIVGSKNNQSLKAVLNGINVLKIVNASLYISCEENEFNYLSQVAPAKRLLPFSGTECADLINTFKRDHQKEVQKFFNDEKEPTSESPKSGVLRSAYSFARKAEHCIDADLLEIYPEIDAEALFMLLFSKGFHENFAIYHKELIKQVIDVSEYAGVPSSSVEIMKKMIATPDQITRREMVQLSSSLREIQQNPLIVALSHRLNSISHLRGDLPFSWHEYTGGEIEHPKNDELKRWP